MTINGNYLAQPQDFHRGHMRNMHDTHEFVAQLVDIINAGERGTVSAARATLKAKSLHSQHPMKNCFGLHVCYHFILISLRVHAGASVGIFGGHLVKFFPAIGIHNC